MAGGILEGGYTTVETVGGRRRCRRRRFLAALVLLAIVTGYVWTREDDGIADDTLPDGLDDRAWHVAELDPEELTWTVAPGSRETDWMVPFFHRGEIWAVTIDRIGEPLRAVRWTGTGWAEVAETRDGVSLVSTMAPVEYPPTAVWTGATLVVGARGGLVSYRPGDDRFAVIRDRRLLDLGASGAWTGSELVGPPNSQNEGFVFVP